MLKTLVKIAGWVIVTFCVLRWPDPTFSQKTAEEAKVIYLNERQIKLFREHNPFLRPAGYVAFTPYIIVLDYKMDPDSHVHEQTHLAQQYKDGWTFFVKYLGYWSYYVVKYSYEHKDCDKMLDLVGFAAYLSIPYEKEAYDMQVEIEDCELQLVD